MTNLETPDILPAADEGTTDILPAADESLTPRKGVAKHPQSHSIIVSAVLGIAVLSLLASTLIIQNHLNSTRTHLAMTQSHLKASKKRIGHLKTNISSLKQSLKTANDGISLQQLAIGGLNNDKQSLNSSLQGTQAALGSANATMNIQSGQIEVLKTCLSGIASAMDALINSYYDAVYADLESVQGACQTAGTYF